MIDGSRATLRFGAKGWLDGRATCNRILDRYRAEEAHLTLEPGGATPLACAEALMVQKTRFLDTLARVDGCHVGDGGALVLTGTNGVAIRARR